MVYSILSPRSLLSSYQTWFGAKRKILLSQRTATLRRSQDSCIALRLKGKKCGGITSISLGKFKAGAVRSMP